MGASCKESSALPEELVQAVYSYGEKHKILNLKDRLRGLAVCRTWQKAFSNLPLHYLELEDRDKQLCQWAVLLQPSVVELRMYSRLDLAARALHSLQRKDLQKLTWGRDSADITRALPMPSMFPNLQHLCIKEPLTSWFWLAGLSSLHKLATLKLSIRPGVQQPAGVAVQFPALARLTRLKLDIDVAEKQHYLVHFQLAGLPALAELDLPGSGARAALLASGSAPQLTRLACSLVSLSSDFSALPGLQALFIDATTQLDRPTSIAAATSLTRLQLQMCNADTENVPATLELLRSLPPSVSYLDMEGYCYEEVAAVIGELPGLVALKLYHFDTGDKFLPPAGASVWSRLRALSVESDAGVNLPKVVQQASRLEALYVNLVDPSEDDYQLLASLPALRKLAIASGCIHETCGRGAAVRCQAQQALPHVSVVKADAVLFECEAFFRWALE